MQNIPASFRTPSASSAERDAALASWDLAAAEKLRQAPLTSETVDAWIQGYTRQAVRLALRAWGRPVPDSLDTATFSPDDVHAQRHVISALDALNVEAKSWLSSLTAAPVPAGAAERLMESWQDARELVQNTLEAPVMGPAPAFEARPGQSFAEALDAAFPPEPPALLIKALRTAEPAGGLYAGLSARLSARREAMEAAHRGRSPGPVRPKLG